MIRRRVLTPPTVPGGDGTPAAGGRTLDPCAADRSPCSWQRRPCSAHAAAATARRWPHLSGEPLDFVAPDVRGGQVVGAELAGKDLVIWFWAPW